jgi:glucan biosynthesis protein C
MHRYWLPADRQNWWGVDALVWLPHLVRMPLFFVVSGFFTACLLARRGMGGMMRQRVRRILVPLLVALPLVHLSIGAATKWAAGAVEHPSRLLAMVRLWLALPDPPSLPPSTGHLWFLYYLMIFSVLFWVCRTLGLGLLLERAVAVGPRVLAHGLPLILLPGFALTAAPHPAPESFLPQFWAIGIFGPFFALGVLLRGRLDWLAPLQTWLVPGALACLCLYALFVWRTGVEPPGPDRMTASWAVAALAACIAAWGTLACLVAGLSWLSRPSAVMRYLAASAYWMYLVHLPLLFAIQYALMDLELHWSVKFSLAVTATVTACLLSYELLVRRTPLRRFVG